jgi:hypothetical protein
MASSIRQTHPHVPSSDSPPIAEWSGHTWYVLRLAALQANDKLTNDQAAELVAFFKAFDLVLPCADCRAHYIADWAEHPFTADQAKSTAESMKWVEDLRIRIEARVKPLATAAAPATSIAVQSRAVVMPPAPAVATNLNPRSAGLRSTQARAAVQRAVAVAVTPPLARSASGDAMSRQVAIKSALQQSAANRAGPRGCNCGRKS